MDEFLQQVVDNMRKNEFEVVELHTAQEACDYLNEHIAAGKTVGVGGSVSVRATGILEKLQEKGCTVYSHWGVPKEEVNPIRRKAIGADVYLCSANAVTRQGKLVLIDGAGNRVASAIYGHKKVWIIVGKNKLAPTYDEALWRARNIAAPKNAQRLHAKTPCAVKADHCYDCKSPGRICRALTVLWGAMMGSDMEVVLVNEDLGY